ncbi:hypothetical protein NIES4071_48150 [Calothrix sp. NIES-4071]|nr:hypothetical protein NIES4071_48150 [Calothrix sp. NIES-4071]BAZ59127.1 hypothetical protein NIES4105_48090 [Calothrix sp. NIES-4105]
MDTIVYPGYICLVLRLKNRWHNLCGETFYNPYNFPIYKLEDLFLFLGLTMKEVANELRKINNAAPVITSADIVERKYYYCGTEWDDVKRTLRE